MLFPRRSKIGEAAGTLGSLFVADLVHRDAGIAARLAFAAVRPLRLGSRAAQARTHEGPGGARNGAVCGLEVREFIQRMIEAELEAAFSAPPLACVEKDDDSARDPARRIKLEFGYRVPGLDTMRGRKGVMRAAETR